MSLLAFPDINVWLALTLDQHVRRAPAVGWLNGLGREDRVFFSRFTQMGLLRLLTTPAVAGAGCLSQAGAWRAYDLWRTDPRIQLLPEPPGLEARFRTLSDARRPAAKQWADAYLAAFAAAAGAVLVTFDRALGARAVQALRPGGSPRARGGG